MDKKPKRTGGVMAIGARRIRFDFRLDGARYRPSLLRSPSETNLRRARAQLAAIKERIATGTFSFADEFPDFRDLNRLRGGGAPTTCGAVFDAFLAHCEARLAKNDLAPITLTTYRRVLNRFWRPTLGALPFLTVRYSTLARIADEHPLSKKNLQQRHQHSPARVQVRLRRLPGSAQSGHRTRERSYPKEGPTRDRPFSHSGS